MAGFVRDETTCHHGKNFTLFNILDIGGGIVGMDRGETGRASPTWSLVRAQRTVSLSGSVYRVLI